MSYPVFDLSGLRRRLVQLRASELDTIENNFPGWSLRNVSGLASWIWTRLRKRYGNAPNVGNSLPWGKVAPPLLAVGTLPPACSLSGTPFLGSLEMVVKISTPGNFPGPAALQWSADGGITFTGPDAAASPLVLGATGLSLIMPAGAYSADAVYSASPPIPETILRWIRILWEWDAIAKAGRSPIAPELADFKEEVAEARAEIKEAADGEHSLFDLPVNEDSDTAQTTGRPLGYSETSPYAAFDRQVKQGVLEDVSGSGSGI